MTEIGTMNIAFGWAWMSFGFITGMVMGLRVEQFGFHRAPEGPTWLGGYDSVQRRLLRLAHVAFIMLPVLNILYGQHIDDAALPDGWKLVGSSAMIFGAVGIPLLCLLAVWKHRAKWFLGVPATAVLVGNLILAAGLILR
ncbi:hypothetical protein FJZ36_16205 [Candidatus Poribacteria bacterium]|nr:hypothetical protein [Candidatus Poribacteria bacterium]